MKPSHHEHLIIKDINDGYLRVDKQGNIWRLAIKKGNNKFNKIDERKISHKDNRGYKQITFRNNKKLFGCQVHRIVWIYFNGNIPEHLQTNHKNGIKTDNRLENLELVTPSENHKHAFKIGMKNQKGENNNNTKLTENNIAEIRKRYRNGETQMSIARRYKVNNVTICYIVNRKQWKHLK